MALQVYCLYVCELRTITHECEVNSTSIDADIHLLTETNLNETVFSDELFCDNLYTVFRRDRHTTARQKSDGGGVIIAIRKHFEAIQETK
ncbi:hypothetical protein JTB14_037645 [Gonioctena quinquepunctata]|nr:hypothetical protein JTB14_037645 [Gonioctena quinquepunctata]